MYVQFGNACSSFYGTIHGSTFFREILRTLRREFLYCKCVTVICRVYVLSPSFRTVNPFHPLSFHSLMLPSIFHLLPSLRCLETRHKMVDRKLRVLLYFGKAHLELRSGRTRLLVKSCAICTENVSASQCFTREEGCE